MIDNQILNVDLIRDILKIVLNRQIVILDKIDQRQPFLIVALLYLRVAFKQNYIVGINVLLRRKKVFIDFFNQFKFQTPQIFLVVPKSWWRQPANDQEWVELPEKPCKGYTLEQLDRIKGRLKGKVILHIDPYKAGAEIKFIKDEVSFELHPFIMNDLNRTAIFKTEVIP